jgi:hypothetical protein
MTRIALFASLTASLMASLTAALTTPANACHRYSRWFYPYPQPVCQAYPAGRPAHAPPVDPSAIAPGDLEKLKAAMKGRS